MTKPAITNRTTKGTPLTYAELDTNFTNLKDATISIQAGTGGTTVTSDLNGTITLVAGSNTTLTGNNTTKTITIDASPSSVTGLTNPLTSNLNTGGYTLYNSSGVVTIDDNLTIQRSGVSADFLSIKNEAALVRIEAGSGQQIQIGTQYDPGTGLQYVGAISITGDPNTEQVIRFGTGLFGSTNSYTKNDTNGFQLAQVTTAQRDSMIATINAGSRDGMMVYNTTVDKFQGYANGAWVDLH
jgi:hypothetical protein